MILSLLVQVKKVVINWPKLLLMVVLISFGSYPWTTAYAEMPTVEINFNADGSFSPDRIEVPAGRFKLILVNKTNQAVEFESIPLRTEKVLGPGVTSFVVLSLSRPGEYPFFDDFHPQAKGTIVVLPKP